MKTPAKIAQLKCEAYGLTDIGLARSNNEDFFYWDPLSQFFILADGMGGHNAGEIAAELASLTISEKVRDVLPRCHDNLVEEVVFHLKNCISYANYQIYQQAQSDPSLNGMGTTICCFLLNGKNLIFAHVGDSRIYRFRKKLTLLTKDHSLRAKTLSLSQTPPLLLRPKWGRNVVTRSIGTAPRVEPEMGWEEAQVNDVYFLCSDGLTDYVPDDVITNVLLASKDLKTACEILITIAKSLGGRDNITILMVKIIS